MRKPARFKSPYRANSQGGIALIIVMLMLVALTGLGMTTLGTTGMDMVASRGFAGQVGRGFCSDQVARFAMEQIVRNDVIETSERINDGTCNSAAVAWVNMDGIPAGNSVCINPLTRPWCGQAGVPLNLTYPACPDTRAIVAVAPTPYTPGGSIVGNQAGRTNASRDRRFAVRIFTSKLPECSNAYLNSYLDVSEIESYTVGGAGDVAN